MDGLFDLPPVLDTPEFREAWEEWKQHRKEQRKPMTPTASRRLLLKMERWGADRAIAAIVHSLENSWQGIFEPRSDETTACSSSGTLSKKSSAAILSKHGLPTPGEAWQMANEASVSGKSLASLPPVVLTATKQFGIERLRRVEFKNMTGAFAQFRKLYEEAVEKELCSTSSPPALRVVPRVS